MRRAFLTALVSVLAASCTAPEPEASAPIAPGRTMSAGDAAACRASGGAVEVRGRIQAEMCVRPFADAGTPCTDTTQCDGKCIAAVEGEVAGTCQRDDRLFGCYAEVENGQRTRAICVD